MSRYYENYPGLLCKNNLNLPEELTCIVVGDTRMELVWEVLGCFFLGMLCDAAHILPALDPVLNTECVRICKGKGAIRL